MNALATLLLATALTIPTPTLVLRNGARIDVDGPVRQEDGRVIFRSGGILYSVPVAEVDLETTRAAGANVTVVKAEAGKLKVSREERQRLLRELEKNHAGTPATAEVLKMPPAPRETTANSEDEWAWRRSARAHEEAVRRAKEEVQLLHDRAEQLRQQIRTLASLGYRPNQFTYQTSELQVTIDSIPRAQLEVERAQRTLEVFREDARKMGILPGWLR
ncbi:MAG: hypothetical protein AABO58_06960 [Acidobacteriota bacterium]